MVRPSWKERISQTRGGHEIEEQLDNAEAEQLSAAASSETTIEDAEDEPSEGQRCNAAMDVLPPRASPIRPTAKPVRLAPNIMEDEEAELSSDGASSEGQEAGLGPSAGNDAAAAGPWKAGNMEFFANFDSGNCLAVTPTAPGIWAAEKPAEMKRPPDVEWASKDVEDGRLMYEVTQSRCPIHLEPDLASKVVTKKSKGARFLAYNRATLNGWQKLAGEKGWFSPLDPEENKLVKLMEPGRQALVQRYQPAVEDAPALVPGDVVLIGSLQKRPELNGQMAEVTSFVAEKERFAVRLLDSGESVLAKGANLRPQREETEEAPAAPEAQEQEDSGFLNFDVTARADCEGTCWAREDCQWFHFGVRGNIAPKTQLRFRIVGLSRFRKLEHTVRGRLLTDGLLPVFCCEANEALAAGKPQGCWQFVRGRYGVQTNADSSLAFTFEHTLERGLDTKSSLFFALTFPYPLSRVQKHLQAVQQRCLTTGNYVRREHLTNSLGGHRIDLLTVTRRSAGSQKRLPPLEGLLPRGGKRPRIFPNRSTVFISARVHPGETPASYALEGLLDFLASDSPSARELLRRYVFQIIPVLNPDGVFLGHHRRDLRGENLNRVYGSATLEEHPSIFASEAACLCTHQHQGGVRLYLDLHAHSNRRGAFVLGDADDLPASERATARLFGYALGRRCGFFEYSQSEFGHSVQGTGKTGMRNLTGTPLCFTVETNYVRGHHRFEPFTPEIWKNLGRSCLQALLDLDHLENSGPCYGLTPAELAAMEEWLADLHWARLWLELEDPSTLKNLLGGPGRACPWFGLVRTAAADHKPSPVVWRSPELMGQNVEIIGRSFPEGCGEHGMLRLHECDGGQWLPSTDIELVTSQHGRFFYGVLSAVGITAGPSPSEPITGSLPPGTVLEARERRVVDGVLRVKIVADTLHGMSASGWASEYKSALFDPRLGGAVQLMRVSSPPRNMLKGRPQYAFPR